MQYDYEWAKQLSDVDIAYIQFLTFFCRNHYRLRYSAAPENNIRLINSELEGVTTVVIRLRSDNNGNNQRMYYLKDNDAKLFYERFCNDFSGVFRAEKLKADCIGTGATEDES